MSIVHDDDDPQFDNDGVWPRRLLHVPTMTSYKWRPGNKYGKKKEPSYHAISYTWGRWSLQDPSLHPNIGALRITGVPWSTPRIDPSHFSVHDCECAVRAAAQKRHPPWKYSDRLWRLKQRLKLGDRSRCDFLWLDIACIDQRGTPEGMSEVGRQARIFRGAKRVYIWLNHTSHQSLSQVQHNLSALTITSRDPENPPPPPEPPLERRSRKDWFELSLQSFRLLVEDPWFSSLWTLQEAFLCPPALLLSREGRLIDVRQNEAFQLNQLTAEASSIYQAARRHHLLHNSSNLDNHSDSRLLTELIERAGLFALWNGEPMTALAMAKFRKTSNDSDRVYGIMQIFGDHFRVGEATGQSKPGQKYTLEQLQDELGALLLSHEPALSQMHIHEQPPAFGKGWRIGLSSAVPSFSIPRTFVDPDSSDPRKDQLAWEKTACKFTTAIIDGTLWGFFQGQICNFQTLEKAWQRQFSSLSSKDLAWEPMKEPLGRLNLGLDRVALLQNLTVPPRQAEYSQQDDHKLAQLVSSHLHGQRAVVLLLSRFETGDSIGEFKTEVSPDSFYGLLLVERSYHNKTIWNRLGICQWYSYRVKTQPENPDRDIILGRGSDWQYLEGVFG